MREREREREYITDERPEEEQVYTKEDLYGWMDLTTHTKGPVESTVLAGRSSRTDRHGSPQVRYAPDLASKMTQLPNLNFPDPNR